VTADELAQLSNTLFSITVALYSLGVVAFCAQLAFGRRPARSRELVGAGAPVESAAEPAVESTRGRRWGLIAMALTGLGLLAHVGILVTRGLATDRLPWGNMYEFATAVVLVAAAAFTVLAVRAPALRHIGAFVMGPVVLALVLIGLKLYTDAKPLVAALRSYWLAIHVTTAILGFGIFFVSGAIVLGFLLAVFVDQKVRLESAFRSVYLYSYAISFVACGVIWQWMFNPTLGIQRTLRAWGWESARFDWIATQDMAIYCIVICVLWHSAGLVMAILLAGLRGIDDELWRAARIEGIPRWRYYISIVLPQLGPQLVTAVVLLAVSVVKLYDAVVAMTNGGPGDATDVPTKFIIDNLFERQNVGLASAASATMLVTVVIIVAPMLYARSRANAAAGRR